SSLDAPKDLKTLTNLTLNLNGSSVSSLDALKDLKRVTNLTLGLGSSSVSSLDAIKDLKTLTHLTLNLVGTRVSSLKAIKDLRRLTDLMLDLGGDRVGSRRISNFDVIKGLKGLTNLRARPVSVAPVPSAALHATLRLPNSPVADLSPLESFENLETLN